MDDSLKVSLRSFLSDEQWRAAALLSSGYQGSAYLFEDAGRKLVVKEAGGGLFTRWFHQHLLKREARVYALLADVDGVPHSPGFLDGTWLVLDYVEGRSLKQVLKTLADPEAFYSTLQGVIVAFHAAGVAHGDLKRKDNVLVDANERPHVIDFGTAVLRDGGWLDRLLYPVVVRIDRNSWAKAKYRFALDTISDADKSWYQPTAAENGFRLLRRFWRTVTFRQARNRRKKSAAQRNS